MNGFLVHRGNLETQLEGCKCGLGRIVLTELRVYLPVRSGSALAGAMDTKTGMTGSRSRLRLGALKDTAFIQRMRTDPTCKASGVGNSDMLATS